MPADASEPAFELWEASTTKLPFPEPKRSANPVRLERETARGHAFQPRVTLLVSSPDGERVAGFAMRAGLRTCVAETERVRNWAQASSGTFLYVLTVGKSRRLVRHGETLTRVLEELYEAASAPVVHAGGR